MNLNQKIQSFLNKHKSKKRWLSATALLSMLITLSVISSLIMPAISMTMPAAISSVGMENVSLYTAAVPGDYSEIPPGTGMLDLMSANTWHANISSGGNMFYDADQLGIIKNEGFEANASPLSLKAYIEYEFTGDVKSYLEGSGPHLCWDLGNPDLTAIFPDGEDHGYVMDSQYSKEIEAGTYTIKDGRVEIKLTSEYIAHVKSGTGNLKGSIEFDGLLNSSNDESGDQKFVINGEEVTIDFPDKWPTIDKSSWVNESNGTIEWTINVINSNYVLLSGYTLTDDMLKNAIDGIVEIQPSSAGSYDNGKIVFSDNHKDNVTIKYKTKITEEQLRDLEGSRTNHAELKKGDKTVDYDDEKANLWKEPFNVDKRGTPDYQTQGGSYNKEINWEITVKNEYGGSLEGYLIEDANIPSSGVTITPSGSLTPKDKKWEITGTNGASTVTIKYTTANASTIETNSNTVKLYYPKGEPTGKEDKEDVEYKDKNALITLAKSGNVNTSNGTIEWTITIGNTDGMDLTDYELSDEMLKSKDLVPNSITINPENAASQPDASGVIKLTADAKNAPWITIKYVTKLTPEQLRNAKAPNEAVLTDPEDREHPKKAPANPSVTQNPFYVRKTGEPDYKSGTYPTDGSNKIKWKIEVRSDNGVSLENYIINDEKIPQDLSPITTSSGTLVYIGGQTIDGKTYAANDWQLRNTNNSKYITIEYEAPVSSTGGIGNENTNDVELKYPDDETTNKTDTGRVTYKSSDDLVGLNKWGNYNQDTHEISWTINVTVEGGYDITGYTIYDDMFKKLDITDIQINYQLASNYATLDKNTGVLTFTSKPNSDNFNITYKTKVEIPQTSTTMVVSNGYGPGPGTTSTATVPVTVRDSLTKSVDIKSQTVEHSGKLVKILNWTANITHDGTFDGLTYVDNLTASSADSHTITDEQLKAIRVYGKVSEYDGNRTQLTQGTDYELLPNNNNNGFTITFKNTLDEKGYNFVDIEYQTTATSNTVKPGTKYPFTSEFSNSADFNGNHKTDKFTLTRNDPEIHTTLNLHLKKSWANDDTSIRPENAYFKVLYHTGDYQWKSVKFASNGDYLFSGDSGYNSATELITLNSSNGSGNEWNKTFDKLPRQIRKANADGSAGNLLTYYYKIEEVKSDGTSIENNLFDVDGGSYKIDYGNNNGVGDKDDIYISATNTLYRETSITPQKTWSGDSGSGTGINTITVQLEYSTNNNNYYPVRKNASGEYVFDQNSTDPIVTQDLTGTENKWIGERWENLPQIIPVGNGYAECSYKIREIKYNDTEINGNRFVVDDGYYNISYSTDANNGNPAVANEYKANKNMSYTAKKEWYGDEAYMTNRPETILVHLKQTGSDGTTKYYNKEPVPLNAGNNWNHTWSGLPSQTTDKKTGKVVTYTYTAEEVGYIKGDKTVNITQDYFATTGDGWYKIAYDYYSTPNNTTIKNTFEPVSTIAITPQKKWVGDSENDTNTNQPFANKNRPQNVTLKLQRRLDNIGEWKDVPISDTATNPITVQLSSGNLLENQYSSDIIWQGAAISNLPSTIITFDADGKSIKHSCEYRLVEWKYTPNENATDKSEKELGADDVSFKTDDGKYEITSSYPTSSGGTFEVTNTFEESIGIEKSVLNHLAQPISSIDVNDLIVEEDKEDGKKGYAVNSFKKIIGAKEYYVFNWMVKYDSNKMDLVSPIVDTLPDGFTLCEDSTYNTKEYEMAWKDKGDLVENGATISDDDLDSAYTAIDPRFKYSGKEGYYLTPVVVYAPVYNNGVATHYGTHYLRKVSSWPYTDSDASYYYDKNKNQVYFPKPNLFGGCVPYYTYSIKIECAELEKRLANGSYSIVNNAERYNNDNTPTNQTDSATLKIINKAPKDLIKKTYAGKTRIPGYFKYSIDVNPEGKNLSTGDTIDIQDLLETVSYFDHDIGANGQTYYNNKKFVDILMDSIKLYEVDANGNKVPLPENQYTRIFKNGDQVSDGAALLQLTIPDETHIVVDYTYKIIANENTPSVINGCKSSTRVNGRYAIMQPGFVPPALDKITFSNKAELISDSASDESEIKNTEYEVSKSSGMITTNRLPQIVKVNTGDYTINDLKAKFLLAKYENSQWYYAIKINDAPKDDGNDEESNRVITWGTSGVTGTKVPSDVKLHEINVKTSYEVALGEEVLYKLIEVNVPNGYEGSNLGLEDEQFKELIIQYLNTGSTYYNNTDYTSFLSNYVSTYYFSYNSIISDCPQEVSRDKIIQIKSGDDLNIPNNELIDIGIKKEWINPRTSTDNTEITVELYWSYKKASSLEKLDDSELHLANAEDLGLMDSSFSAIKTIPIEYNEDGSVKPNEKVWENLPNGKNSVPIYYYVKETGYTIGGETYTLDEEDGNFKNVSGDTGLYRPTYIGNAANSDATINIRNSHQLMLKKSWKNSSNIELKNIPVEKVVVSIYGIDNDGAETKDPLFENIELSAANKWTVDLTKEASGINLSQYKSFVAKENDDGSLEDFVVSCVFNLNKDTGEIIVTNKNTVPTEASVSVNKVWSDGKDIHANESIKVSLYQSKTKIDDLSDLALKLTNIPVMPKLDKDGNPVKDEAGEIMREIVTLNAENDWSYTWTGLPLEDENQNKYYYYVLEDKTGITDANKYTESYEIIASTPTKTDYTVTNTRKAIVVQKKWVDEEGNIIPDDQLTQDSITLDVLKKVSAKPNKLKIHALGDSITDGSLCENGISYANTKTEWTSSGTVSTCLLADILTADHGFSSVSVCEDGTNSEQISQLYNRSLHNDDDVITLLIGTNDIIQKTDLDNAMTRLEELIKKMYNQTDKTKPMFVASIPNFNHTNTSNNKVISEQWFTKDGCAHKSAINGMSNQEIETYVNGLIKTYNDQIPALISKLQAGEYGYNIHFVDINSKVNKDTDLYDGCHPNVSGSTNIAKAFASAINSYYKQSSKVGEITLTKDNGWIGAFDITDTDTSAEYYIEERTVPAGWQVTYDEANRYQKLGSSTPLVAINTRNIPKTSLSVEKTWANDTGGEANREAISLTLLQSTDRRNWVEYDTEMPTPNKTDNIWTYTYTDLPAQDNAGNPYYYKIEEAPMQGYTTSYGIPSYLTSVNGGNAGTLKITNTAAVSLKICKIWTDSDTNNHMTDSVTFKLYRDVVKSDDDNPRDDFDESTLILEVDKTAVGVTVGNTVQVNANKPVTITQSDGSESIFTANLGGNSKTINIEGHAEGGGEITVTAGIDKITIGVTVSAYKLQFNGVDVVDEKLAITAGEQNHKLSVTKGGEPFTDVTYSSSDESVLTVSANGEITTKNAGKATVTVSTGDATLTQDITVNLPSDFEITGGTEVTIGEDVQLSVSPSYGSFEWSSSSDAVATVDSTGKVHGVAEGTVTITVKREAYGDVPELSKTYVIGVQTVKKITLTSVTSGSAVDLSKYDYQNIKAIGIKFNVNSSANISDANFQVNFGNVYKSKDNAKLEDGIFIISFSGQQNANLTINNYNTYACPSIDEVYLYYEDPLVAASANFFSLRSASEPQMLVGAGFVTAEPMTAGIDGSTITSQYEFTISGGSANNSWEKVINNLPVYDSNGNPYIYWVEEVSGADGYEASYQFSDGDPDSSSWINSSIPNADGKLEVTVRNTKTDTPGYELPSTGGEGVTRYYYTGAALILLSAFAGSNRIRRRLKERRTK